MPQNVEIKARTENLDEVKLLAEKLSGSDATLIEQEDTFFICPRGYLKLRIIKGATAQLIHYERPKQTGPKVSEYCVTPVEHPESLKETLVRAYGVRGAVSKMRWLFMVGQTRVHCDTVQHLGDHVELEVQLQEGQTQEEGTLIAHDLMKKLHIDPSKLMTGTYMEEILRVQAEKQ